MGERALLRRSPPAGGGRLVARGDRCGERVGKFVLGDPERGGGVAGVDVLALEQFLGDQGRLGEPAGLPFAVGAW